MRFLFIFLFSGLAFCQNTNTEIYLFDLVPKNASFEVKNGQNISNNAGYDNQPSFYDNEAILFSRMRNEQTDVAKYDMKTKEISWLTETPEGGEYSPQHIPDSEDFAAVRLDTSGLQRLYRYETKTSKNTTINDLKIGYFAFYNNSKFISAVLSGSNLDLYLSDISSKKDSLIVTNIGRSLHKVPNTNSMSYTVINEDQNMDLYLLDMGGELESYFVCQLPIGIQDYVWLNDSQILLGSRDHLYIYDTLGVTEWKEMADLSEYHLKNITRLAVSSDGNHLAVVAEPIATNGN
ncbi:MAG: hypothetical protein V7767_13405 [Leeuwenhoekiella sp.]